MIANTLMLCRILLMARLSRHWTVLIQNLHGTLGVSVLGCQWMVCNLRAPIVVHILAG
jgi:hypothetical protein